MKNFIIGLVRFYQKHWSVRAACCRFIPTCSEYMILSIEKHGVIKGLLKGIWRILRCNPLNKNHGIDLP